jgi:hypothetical protein
MAGIRVLNVDLKKKTAVIYDRKFNPLYIETNEFINFLCDDKIKEISVDLKSDWELTLFELHKNSNNEWIAHENDKEYLVGKSENITFSKILEIDNYFKELK